MTPRPSPAALRRAAAELALLVGIGLLLGAIGPYDTNEVSPGRRVVYWLLAILGGGAAGIAIDTLLERRLPARWPRVAATAVLMTPVVTLWVMALGHLLSALPFDLRVFTQLLWNVFLISLPIMAVRALARRPPATVVETRTVVAPPLPEAEAVFRRRLSARRRAARLIAVEAHDHYLRVHTDAGTELITARFADALDELAGAHGHRTHRSWWVAADAILDVRWRRGVGEARLAGEVQAPVSRTYASALREAGWGR